MTPRNFAYGVFLATATTLSSVASIGAWPLLDDMRASEDALLVPVQMRGGGGMGGGMAGMAGGAGGMAGGKAAIGGGMAAKAGMGAQGAKAAKQAGGKAAKQAGGKAAKQAGGKAAKGTAAKGTAAKGTAAKGTAAKGTAAKGTAAKGTAGKGGGGPKDAFGKATKGGGAAGTGGGVTNVNVSGSVRPWVSRPYYGTIVGGVALGSLIAATTIPPAPSPELCWIWASAEQTQGYWDYCTPPQ